MKPSSAASRREQERVRCLALCEIFAQAFGLATRDPYLFAQRLDVGRRAVPDPGFDERGKGFEIEVEVHVGLSVQPVGHFA